MAILFDKIIRYYNCLILLDFLMLGSKPCDVWELLFICSRHDLSAAVVVCCQKGFRSVVSSATMTILCKKVTLLASAAISIFITASAVFIPVERYSYCIISTWLSYQEIEHTCKDLWVLTSSLIYRAILTLKQSFVSALIPPPKWNNHHELPFFSVSFSCEQWGTVFPKHFFAH